MFWNPDVDVVEPPTVRRYCKMLGSGGPGGVSGELIWPCVLFRPELVGSLALVHFVSRGAITDERKSMKVVIAESLENFWPNGNDICCA